MSFIISNLDIEKKKNIKKIVDLMLLQPKQLGPALPGFITTQVLISNKDVSETKIFESVFDKLFSVHEIEELLKFYSSDVNKKILTDCKDLFEPIFVKFRELLQEEIDIVK